MSVKVVGVSRKTGEGEIDGKQLSWDNMMLHLLNDKDPDTTGASATQLKVKYGEFEKLTGLRPEEHFELIGKEVEFNYMPSGGRGQPKLSAIRVIGSKEGGDRK